MFILVYYDLCVFLAVGLFSIVLSCFVWHRNFATLWHDGKRNCVIEASIEASIEESNEIISYYWLFISDE